MRQQYAPRARESEITFRQFDKRVKKAAPPPADEESDCDDGIGDVAAVCAGDDNCFASATACAGCRANMAMN